MAWTTPVDLAELCWGNSGISRCLPQALSRLYTRNRGSLGTHQRAIRPARVNNQVRCMTKLVTFINSRFDNGRYPLAAIVAAQMQQLLVQRDLHWTHVRTRPAQAAGVGQ